METLLKTYIRDEKKNPVGIAIAVKHNDEVLYGYSLCNINAEPFDKELGFEKAMYRAMSPEGYKLPQVPERFEKVINAYQKLQERAVKYFKDLEYKNIVLTEVESDGHIQF